MNIKPNTAANTQPTSDALAFKENLYYEKLIRLRTEKPEVFNSLSYPERMSLVYYLDAKNKATGKASMIDESFNT